MSFIGLPIASASVLGGIKVGVGLTINPSTGVLDATGTPAGPATTTTLGLVIVPTAGNLTVDGSGNIGVPTATGATKGVVIVTAGNGLSLSSGTVALALATTTTAGTVIVPTANRLTVDGSGNIGVPIATGSVLGVVKIGSGLSIDGTGLLTTTGGAGFSWTTTNTNTTAVTARGYSVDTSGGVVVLTAPASPSVGDYFKWTDAAGTFGTNKLTIGRNGEKIMGLAQDMDVSDNYASAGLVYDGGTNGWRLSV
jgi:hypothetical protein